MIAQFMNKNKPPVRLQLCQSKYLHRQKKSVAEKAVSIYNIECMRMGIFKSKKEKRG